MNGQLAENERVSRFVFDKGRLNGSPKMINQSAFNDPGGVSLSRIDGLDSTQIWSLGDAAGLGRQKVAIARGDLLVKAIRELGLDVIADEPPERHALIDKWPTFADPDSLKEESRILRQRLASAAETVIR